MEFQTVGPKTEKDLSQRSQVRSEEQSAESGQECSILERHTYIMHESIHIDTHKSTSFV